MSAVSDITEALEAICTEIERAYKGYSETISGVDKLVGQLYHTIETTEFEPTRGYELAMQLQAALRMRRGVKEEQGQLTILHFLRGQIKGHLKRLETKGRD